MVRVQAVATDAVGNAVPRDQIVVGLDNGAVKQWSGVVTGSTGQRDWKEITGPDANTAQQAITKDGDLQKAVDFAKKLVAADKPDEWDTAIGGTDDPLFKNGDLQRGSTASGVYKGFASYIPNSPAALPFTVPGTDTSVKLAFDANLLSYGYTFVPDGALAKLVPGKYSLAMLVALEAGPSLTLNLGKGGTINIPSKNLFDVQFSAPGPFGIDHYYPDVNVSELTALTGISITPTLTPFVTGTYGIFFPRNYWLIGGWSLFDLSLGYQNPVSATFCADSAMACENGKATSVKLDSKGFITTHAGILESITSALSWDGKYQVYDVSQIYTDVLAVTPTQA